MASKRSEQFEASRPEVLQQCFVPVSYDDPESGYPVVITAGMKLRSSHWAVRSNGQYLHPENLPHDERPRLEDLIKPGVTTTHRPAGSGWRRDRHDQADRFEGS